MPMKMPGRAGQGHDGMSLAAALRGCLGDGVVLIDPAAGVATFTPQAAQLFGLPNQSSLEYSSEALPTPLRELAAEALKTPSPLAYRHFQVSMPAGRTLALEVNAFRVGRDGHNSSVLLLVANLDSIRQCEERLQRLDRLANLGTLAATMAHEVKNALVAGRTFVDLLLEKNPEAELTEVVRRELARIDAIIARLLKFAAPTRASFSPVRLHDLLDHALRLLQPQLENRDITLDRQLNAGSDVVTGDEGELLQAIMNLLLNGLEAMAPEGKLTVRTEAVKASDAGSSAPGRIRITIADTGVGISSENLPHLFDPFFTTKPSGTGLGLAVTKRIIQEHHGELTVESRPGQGTSFSIVLPGAVAPR